MSPKEKELRNLLAEANQYLDDCMEDIKAAERQIHYAIDAADCARTNLTRVCFMMETLLYGIALEDSKAQPEPESEHEVDL